VTSLNKDQFPKASAEDIFKAFNPHGDLGGLLNPDLGYEPRSTTDPSTAIYERGGGDGEDYTSVTVPKPLPEGGAWSGGSPHLGGHGAHWVAGAVPSDIPEGSPYAAGGTVRTPYRARIAAESAIKRMREGRALRPSGMRRRGVDYVWLRPRES